MLNRSLLGIGIAMVILAMAPASPIRADHHLATNARDPAIPDPAVCEVHAVPHCGDREAQYRLGLMFKDGIGVPMNEAAALEWFLCAAQSDDQIGIDAARWAELLSTSLEVPYVPAAWRNLPGCRTVTAVATRPDTSESTKSPDVASVPYRDSLRRKFDQLIKSIMPPETPRTEDPFSTDEAGAPKHRDSNARRTTAAPGRRSIGPTAPSGSSRLDLQESVAAPDRGWSGPAADSNPPSFRTQGAIAVPERRNLWSKVFYLPADGTVVGSQHIAWNLGADNLLRDIKEIARDRDDWTLAFFAIFWWALIGKTLTSVGCAIFGSSRKSGARRFGRTN